MMTPDQLRAWAKRLGFTYNGAASALKVSRTAYAEWLSGKYKIPGSIELLCGYIERDVEAKKNKPLY